MAEINPHWARWIAASLAVYFKTVADNAGITLLVEGIDERESEKMEVDRAELRINGPFIRQLSEGYFRLDVDTNILLTDLMGGEERRQLDGYRGGTSDGIGRSYRLSWRT